VLEESQRARFGPANLSCPYLYYEADHILDEAATAFSITLARAEICQTRQNPRRMRATRV
jgi:hypothetical protein